MLIQSYFHAVQSMSIFYDYTRFFIDTKILTKLLVTKKVIEIFFSKLSNVKLNNIKNILVLGITTDDCFVFGVNETQ